MGNGRPKTRSEQGFVIRVGERFFCVDPSTGYSSLANLSDGFLVIYPDAETAQEAILHFPAWRNRACVENLERYQV